MAAACSAAGDDDAFPPRGRSPTTVYCLARLGPAHTREGPRPMAMRQGLFYFTRPQVSPEANPDFAGNVPGLNFVAPILAPYCVKAFSTAVKSFWASVFSF